MTDYYSLFFILYYITNKGTQPCLGLLEKVLLEKSVFFFLEKGDGAHYAIKF